MAEFLSNPASWSTKGQNMTAGIASLARKNPPSSKNPLSIAQLTAGLKLELGDMSRKYDLLSVYRFERSAPSTGVREKSTQNAANPAIKSFFMMCELYLESREFPKNFPIKKNPAKRDFFVPFFNILFLILGHLYNFLKYLRVINCEFTEILSIHVHTSVEPFVFYF